MDFARFLREHGLRGEEGGEPHRLIFSAHGVGVAAPPAERGGDAMRDGVLRLLGGEERSDAEIDALLEAPSATSVIPLPAVPNLFAPDARSGQRRRAWIHARLEDLTDRDGRFEEQALVVGERIAPIRLGAALRLFEAALRLTEFAYSLQFPVEEKEPAHCVLRYEEEGHGDGGEDGEDGEGEGEGEGSAELAARNLVVEGAEALGELLSASVSESMREDAQLLVAAHFTRREESDELRTTLLREAQRLRGGRPEHWALDDCIGTQILQGLHQSGAVPHHLARRVADVFALPAPPEMPPLDDEAVLRERASGRLSLTTERRLGEGEGGEPLLPGDVVAREAARVRANT